MLWLVLILLIAAIVAFFYFSKIATTPKTQPQIETPQSENQIPKEETQIKDKPVQDTQPITQDESPQMIEEPVVESTLVKEESSTVEQPTLVSRNEIDFIQEVQVGTLKDCIESKELEGTFESTRFSPLKEPTESKEPELVKKPSGRSFNFRANKSKIESLLRKDSFLTTSESDQNSLVSSEINLDDITNLTRLDSTNETMEISSDNISIEKELKAQGNSPIKQESMKLRGFNFKNPKAKQTLNIFKENIAKGSSISSIVEESGKENTPFILPKEEKKPKGFNFRNQNKVKVE